MELEGKKNLIYRLMFAVILYTITYTIIFKLVVQGSDYRSHMIIADKIQLGSIVDYFLNENPYFMWHILIKLVSKILYIPMEYAVAIVSALINVLIYCFINKIMKIYYVEKSELISFILLLVGPLYIPWYNEKIYLGQGTPNIWHNPTSLVVKPFAICCFFMVLKLLASIQQKIEIKRKQYITLSILIFLSVLAKPSFIQGFIPGLGGYLLILCIKDKFRNFKQYIYLCFTFVPGVFLMMYQFIASFYKGDSAEGIGISWLEVPSYFSPNVWISLLLLFFFPILYLLWNIKKVYQKMDIQLSICYQGMAWLEYALLYENGRRKYHGNFGWASALSTFILWMVVLIYFVNDIKEMKMNDKRQVIKNSILLAVLLFHLLCGCYYIFCLITVEGMKF